MSGDPIADLRSPSGSLISVFIDRPSPGGFGALLSDLVRPIKERSDDLDRKIQKSVRYDADRIHGLADRLEVDVAPAYAIFASDLDDVFIIEPLAHPTYNVSTLGPRPYLRPLRAAPRGLRSGVIIADRTVARTFAAFEGLVEELGEPINADVGKSNYGGFAGYDEHTVRGHAEEASHRLWKEAGWRMLEEHQNRPFDYLVIGGHEETVEEISRTLHPYLARLQRTYFTTNPQSFALPNLRAEMRGQDIEVRRKRQEALAGRVCDTAWGGGNAVLGLNATLDAVNAQAVDTLVVAGQFAGDGAICNQCGYLTRNGNGCPICSSPLFGVDDVVAAVMDATVTTGGRVHQIDVASPLDKEGIGALTRFPLPV